MSDRETLKLALEALEWGLKADELPSGGHWDDMAKESITALRQALEQTEQEFVSWGYRDKRGKIRLLEPSEARMDMFPLYTAPPQREWVGLTDEEIQKVAYDMGTIGDLSHDEFDICRAIEAKLKEKNRA